LPAAANGNSLPAVYGSKDFALMSFSIGHWAFLICHLKEFKEVKMADVK